MNKKIKYILIVIAILIISIGGTYAYLYITASSSNISGKAETINVSLVNGTNVIADNLIPSSEEIVDSAYTESGSNRCKDANGLQVCSVYTFTITNNTTSGIISVNGNLNSTANGFTNLKYKVYKTSGNVSGNLTSTMTSAPIASGSSVLFSNMVFGANVSATYDVVIWLNETNNNQSSEMEKSFVGYISISNASGIEAVYD